MEDVRHGHKEEGNGRLRGGGGGRGRGGARGEWGVLFHGCSDLLGVPLEKYDQEE